MNIGHLVIKDRRFEISEATLRVARGYRGHEWTIDINTKSRRFDGETWKPRLYGEAVPMDAGIPSLKVGNRFWVKKAYEEETGQYLFVMYVFGHSDVYSSSIEIEETSGSEVKILWKGLCDVFWDDEYGKALPFQCSTWIAITE